MKTTILLLTFALASPALALNCYPDGMGGWRCDNGVTTQPDGMGGWSNSDGTHCWPDGMGGFRCN